MLFFCFVRPDLSGAFLDSALFSLAFLSKYREGFQAIRRIGRRSSSGELISQTLLADAAGDRAKGMCRSRKDSHSLLRNYSIALVGSPQSVASLDLVLFHLIALGFAKYLASHGL